MPKIQSPDDIHLDDLCNRLAEKADSVDQLGWPAEQLHLCGEYGVYEWFLPAQYGGQDWSDLDVIRGYLRLSAACLTTTFIITQRTGACRRIAASENEQAKSDFLPALVQGRSFSTVGISHLTTSRRHLKSPVLRAEISAQGFVLDGFSPWVTGGKHADSIVTGAQLDDGRQILVVLPTDLPGIDVPAPVQLVGVNSSHTGQVNLNNVEVSQELLLAGPQEDVMSGGIGARTGGLQTSTLAIGLAQAAITFLAREAEKRDSLTEAYDSLRVESETLTEDLLHLAAGEEVCSNEDLRRRANSLVLRATQAALTAAKGSGYVVGHPAGRWCREALFFLVWSCPQPVMQANLCELAGIQF